MTTRFFIIFFVVLVVIALLLLIQQLANLKRRNRVQQVTLPIFSTIYCIVAISVALLLYDRVDGLIKTLLHLMPTDIFESLLRVLPEELAQGFEEFEGTFMEFLAYTGYITKVIIIALNVLLYIGFLIVKLIFLPVSKLLWKKVSPVQKLSGNFYEYDDNYSDWFIKQRWANVRSLGRAFQFWTGLICVIFLSMIIFTAPSSMFWVFCIPIAALIIIGEGFNYINGLTSTEVLTKIQGDDSSSRRISSFFRIRGIYESMFSPQLLTANTGTDFTETKSSADYLEKLSDGDKNDRMTAEYFSIIDNKYKTDLDSVVATNNLMHGKSVIFLNPFYRDVGTYIIPPMMKGLLRGKKCLVVIGRNSTLEDVKKWLPEELAMFNRTSSLWRIRELNCNEPECDVGIISTHKMYDMEIIKANRSFFNETDFTLIIEPSMIVNIGQIGFSIIIDEIHKNVTKPVFCICDRNADGLVDTMSHILRTEITEVVAPPVPRCIFTAMTWDADGDYSRQRLFDKQTRYMGNGIELAAVAIKNQIPKVIWYSETKSPVRDIYWISGLFYSTLCKYMNLPTQQANLHAKIGFESNIWSVSSVDESFSIVDDEFCNMFNTLRAYLSRGRNQAFVNIMSENYLLRDYMRCNPLMFLTDPGAIPSFVPDYAKTLRNTVIKLILCMISRPVGEEEILTQLRLAGHDSDDAFGSISRLTLDLFDVDTSVFTITSITNDDALHAGITNIFTITQESFEKYFAETLKSAFFIIEDELSDSNYIDAKLFGHVTQVVLPGQFVTYDGKYYFAKIVCANNGVVLRRASDLYDARKYYRQIRKYTLDTENPEITNIRRVMDVEIAYFNCSINVHTTGYLDMTNNNDLYSARVIDFADDPLVNTYRRKYHNKTVMRIHFPESDDTIRFTVCMLLMEAFRSMFPNSWQYIAALSTRPDDISGMLNYVNYELEGDLDNEYIYIVEDSDVDLGLLGAIDKNLIEIMEILADYLDWHFEKMREAPQHDPVLREVTMPADVVIKRRGFFARIRSLFTKREEEVRVPNVPKDATEEPATDKKPVSGEGKSEESKPDQTSVEHSIDDEETADAETDSESNVIIEDSDPPEHSIDDEENEDSQQTAVNSGAAPAATPATTHVSVNAGSETSKLTKAKTGNEHREDLLDPEKDPRADIVHVDGTDIFDEDGDPHDEEWLKHKFEEAGVITPEKTRYQEECYIKYGFEEIDSRIRIEKLRSYLRFRGFTNNNLTKSRLRSVAEKTFIDLDAVNTCDFCAIPLTGINYDRLSDGRVRCQDCATSAVVTVAEAREIYYKVLDLLDCFFGITINVPIGIKFVDARKVAAGVGRIFTPSSGVSPRVLGYAAKMKGNYFLCMENGSPRLAFIDTLVHELTHIWQFVNWNDKEISSLYGSGSNRDIVYEGMATWAAIQYMYLIGESSYAMSQEHKYEEDESVYGIGFQIFREKYPLIKDLSIINLSPFKTMPPL